MLSIQHINKQYAGHRALNDVSMEIESGSIFGLLGPNGAGKTSLIRIINQITGPDSGEVLFEGEHLQPKHISRIGYLPEERGLYKKMEIGEQVLYLAQLKGLSRAEAMKKVKYWFEKLEIESWWNKKVEELSKGMQQKVQFVATVLHDPSLIILDEPFSGFDPINADLIKNEILELNQKGATIIFSTHRMESVEELCTSIALINKSKKILEGKVKAIKEQFRTHTYRLCYAGEALEFPPALGPIIEQQNHSDYQQVDIQLQNGTGSNELLTYVLNQRTLISFQELIPSINEIFISQVTATDKH